MQIAVHPRIPCAGARVLLHAAVHAPRFAPRFAALFTALFAAPFAALLAGLPAAACAASPATGREVLVVGDSLSAEFGLARGSGWVPRLAVRMSNIAPQYSVVNASISGDTSSGGLARLPGLLREHHPAIVVLELGGNDGLRGLSVRAMRSNLEAMSRAARAAGAKVLVVGMQIPPNYGEAYTRAFGQAFAEVAKEEHAALVPFLLEGFALDPTAFQGDRIHPNAGQQERMMENVWVKLKPLL